MHDEPAFQKAVKDSVPDEKHIQSLKREIAKKEKELKRIEKELDK